ncbi:hypothetical protein F5884DRAFT_777900 [Xylogone sp. PMI_703]|nr:hypothetical protein F5884DRAFT_777900 [Xylogone sp. PMI_703]
MSDYPPTPSFGTGFGQPNPPYAPNYRGQYLQRDEHQMRSQFPPPPNPPTYGYNQTIPMYNTVAVQPGLPQQPVFQNWNQEVVPPPNIYPRHDLRYPSYAEAQQTIPYAQPPSAHSYNQHNVPTKAAEEGEISEGEFEDRSIRTQPPFAMHQQQTSTVAYPGTGSSIPYESAPRYQSEQYSATANEYHTREFPQTRQNRSESYSPPRDIGQSGSLDQQYNSSMPGNPHHSINGTDKDPPQQTWSQHALSQNDRSETVREAVYLPDEPKTAQNNAAQRRSPEYSDQKPPYKSLAEARKRAQGAILNLLPLEVRYQTYIDEGFDETIIRQLFNELGMDSNSSKSTSAPPQPDLQLHSNRRQNLSPGPSSHATAASKGGTVSSAPTNTVDGKGIMSQQNSAATDKREERKDRIARLLAEKSNKQPPAKEPVIQAPVSLPPTAAKSSTSSDKETLLKMKMEALRKSREERAQKTAAKITLKSPTSAEEANEKGASDPISASSAAVVPISPKQSASRLFPKQNSAPPSRTPSIQPTMTVQQQQTPMIPGLFLASNISSSVNSVTQHVPRKRPVAADFDASSASVTPKKPFGHSRDDRPLVIDVSEDEADEDEDVAMEIDSQIDQDSPNHGTKATGDPRNSNLQKYPPLTDFPSRKPYTPPTSTKATPPLTQTTTKAIIGNPQDLQRKEKEIEEMKRKIAEAEKRKKAKQNSSGTNTPTPSTTDASNVNIAGKLEASKQIERLINRAEEKASFDRQKLADIRAVEAQTTADVKGDNTERRRLRRAKLASDLPLVDAEVEQNQLRLEQLRAEMAAIEAAVQKSLEEKRRLAEEMERLGEEAEEQLQVQKDKLASIEKGDDSPIDISLPASTVTPDTSNDSFNTTAPATQDKSLQAITPEADSQAGVSSPNSSSHAAEIIVPLLSNAPSPASDAAADVSTASSEASQRAMHNSSNGHFTESLAPETVEQSHVQTEAASQSTGESDVDMEDVYEPESFSTGPEMETGIESPVASVSAEDETPDIPDAGSDIYEPPEATSDDGASDSSSPLSPPFTPEPPNSVNQQHEEGHHSGNPPTEVLDTDEISEVSLTEPLPTENRGVPSSIKGPPEEPIIANDFFTPYMSPLRYFRAFRFHPEFRKQIDGGFRSLTYSHKIDLNKPLCRYELAGGICNDSTCELQHFRDMGLPDDAILTDLGSPDEFTGEQRSNYVMGLKEVLLQMRVNNTRDFETIASEITQHRAKFLNDKSKVLLLEGVTL